MGMLMVACGTTKKSQSEEQKAVSILFSADSAYAYCAAQCQYGPRTMNSEAHEQCGQWIAEKFRQYGCDVELQQADLKGYDGTILKSTNIIAKSQKLMALATPHSQRENSQESSSVPIGTVGRGLTTTPTLPTGENP